MSYDVHDTIAAIASAAGGSLRGIIRISGPAATTAVERCLVPGDRGSLTRLQLPTVVAGTLRIEPLLGELPAELYVWPTSRSYSRQPTIEIHTLGSPAVLDAILRLLSADGVRLAERGEFTLRAFLAGRLDLTQVEAVLGVIDAGGQRELEVALAQLAGGLAGPLNALRNQLLDLLAHLEAGLDFVDDQIEFITPERLIAELAAIGQRMADIHNQIASRAERADEPRVVLRGGPNVGKSSLLNALVGERAAIVADVAGTTRDYVARRMNYQGTDWLLVDTAGVDGAAMAGTLEAAAQRVTDDQVGQAQLELFCLDASRPIDAWEQRELAADDGRQRLVVYTKADLACGVPTGICGFLPSALVTSAATGQGVDQLLAAIADHVAQGDYAESNVVGSTAVRCRTSLRAADECLGRAHDLAAQDLGEELVAAELRSALDELGAVVGAVYTDDVLDRIFSRFCIGK